MSGDKDRQRLLHNTASLERSSAGLDRANQLALQSIEIGTGILADLDDQGQQIQKLRHANARVDNHLTRSHKVLKRMTCESSKQKIIGWIAIALLVAILILVLILKFYS